jgi:hypothetical protein
MPGNQLPETDLCAASGEAADAFLNMFAPEVTGHGGGKHPFLGKIPIRNPGTAVQKIQKASAQIVSPNPLAVDFQGLFIEFNARPSLPERRSGIPPPFTMLPVRTKNGAARRIKFFMPPTFDQARNRLIPGSFAILA